jgi:hypothetical protein
MKALGPLALLLLAGCGPVDTTRWQERQAAIDPPMLWRVRVVGGPVASNPVEVCADSIMHAGFMEPMPTLDGQRCQPVDGRRALGPDRRLVCQSQGRRYAVTSHLAGDPDAAFTVRFAVQPLGRDGAYEQTRRYERLGRCPAGWRVGAHTDQQGRRHADARW